MYLALGTTSVPVEPYALRDMSTAQARSPLSAHTAGSRRRRYPLGTLEASKHIGPLFRLASRGWLVTQMMGRWSDFSCYNHVVKQCDVCRGCQEVSHDVVVVFSPPFVACRPHLMRRLCLFLSPLRFCMVATIRVTSPTRSSRTERV